MTRSTEATRRLRASPRRRALGLLLAAVVTATVPAVWFARVAVGEVADEIEAGRLRLAQLAATQADRVVAEAFFEIELMAQSLTLDEGLLDPESQADALQSIHRRGASFHSGVLLLDGDGDRVAAVPPGAFGEVTGEALAAAGVADDRAVSEPWLDTQSVHAMAALSIPLYAPDGTRAATIVGIMDLAEPLISDLIVPAARLGPTGHADLVDDRGVVLASTEPGLVLTTGDHPDFYARAAATRSSQVERVAHIAKSGSMDESEWHIMAYAPLQNAPWGVAMGADERETMEPVRRLLGRLLALGSASAVTLLLGVALAVRWIPRREDD